MAFPPRPSPSPRSRWALALFFVLGSSLGCSASAGNDGDGGAQGDMIQPPPECEATAPNRCPDTMPTWTDVRPIFTTRCAVCHGSEAGLWPLNEYSHVVDWNVEIRSMVLDCTMPPPDSDVTITLEERQLILEWLRCGFPR